MIRGMKQWDIDYLESEIDATEDMGDSIRSYRTFRKGLTVQQLADAVGVPTQDINDYEEGRKRVPLRVHFESNVQRASLRSRSTVEAA